MLMFAALLVSGLPMSSLAASLPPAIQVAATGATSDVRLGGDCALAESPDRGVFFPNKGAFQPTHVHPALTLQKFNESKGLGQLDLSAAKVAILEAPQHGRLVPVGDQDSYLGTGFAFTPDKGYRGADYITAMVEFGGKKISIKIKLVVVEAVIDGETGYMDGNSGGGAALDKEANHCLFKTRVFKIGQVASGL